MPVSKSPFSKSQKPSADDATNPWEFKAKQAGKKPSLFTDTDVLAAAGSIKASGDEKLKTTLQAESNKLDSAYRGALAKISMSRLSDGEKKRATKALSEIYTTGKKETDVDITPWTLAKSGMGAVFGAAGKLFEASSAISRYAQSGIKEVADIVMYDPDAKGKDKMDASWDDFFKQAKKDSGFQLLPKTNLNIPQTGIGFIDKFIPDKVDSVIDFGVDQFFDPLNWVGVGELKYLGKVGKFELLTKLGTTEMMTKYPELIGKLDDIARYGVDAVPKTVRQAEGLKQGLRVAGTIVPHTEAMSRFVSGRYGIATAVRNVASDTGAKITNKLGLAGKFTPAKRLNMRIAEIGMKKGVPDAVVRQNIAEYTATKYAKGFKSQAYNTAMSRVKDLLTEVRKAGKMDEVALLADDAAALALEPDAQLREWATQYRKWQDEVLTEVNSVRAKFNKDYGADMRMINKIDDYGIHHKMTDKAFKFAYGEKGRATGFFRDADLTPMELGGNTGAAMFRRYTYGEKFMDETLTPEKGGIIKQINEIFKEKAKVDFNFFETDLASVADSYAYSLSAKRGQEAFVRRLLDFGGDDVAKIIEKKLIPDKQLVGELRNSYKALNTVRKELQRTVNKGRALATNKTKEVVQFARQAIDLKDAEAATLNRQIGKQINDLYNIEVQLHRAAEMAAQKGGAERGAFEAVWGGLINDVRQLRTNLEQGRISEVAAYDALRDIYRQMRPDAKRIPKSASKLLDVVQKNEGIGDFTQVRALERRLEGVQQQLADTAGLNPQDLNDLLDIEQNLIKEIDGFRQLGVVKMEASYAEDGLLFGTTDDLMERQFDPNMEPKPRVVSTRPISEGGAEMTSDEIAALRNAQLSDPNSVAFHAIPEDTVIDMRQPEHFYDFWNPDNGAGDAVNYALERAGIGDGVFKEIWDDAMMGNPVDPMFEEVYPELADLMTFVGSMHANQFPTGIVDDDFNVQSFETLKDLFTSAAAALNPDQSDLVGKQMFDDFMLAMVNEGVGNTGRPLLLPSGSIYGVDNAMADGAYSVVLPDSYNYPSLYGRKNVTDDMIEGTDSPVYFTSQDEFIKNVIDDGYHTASLDVNETLAGVSEAGQQLQADLAQREALRKEAQSVGGQIGNMKAAGSRRVKAAQRAYKDFEESGMVTVTFGGKKMRMPRDKALAELTKGEQKVISEVAKLDKKLERITNNEIAPVLKRKAKLEERLGTLVNQRRVLETWNAQTGDALRAEIDVLKTAVMTDPPAGWAGTTSRQWSDRITKAIDNIQVLEGSPAKDAWERVITQLGADESQLALMETVEIPAVLQSVQLAKSGFIGGKWVDDIEKGWKALEGTGVQLPEEFHAILQPNIAKLKNRAERTDWFKAYKIYNQLFKIYATMTPGFVMRNAMSAVFMNKVAGVSNKAIYDGTKAMVAYTKHGPDKWLDVLGITDAVEREMYNTALRSVHATGRISADFASPVLRDGWAHKMSDNWATKKLSGANEFVENSVRFPMALDSLRKGSDYDQAVFRISRYHFDYTDLSKFDEGMKNFIPFWVWTSRNLPLQMTEQFLNPRYYNMYEDLKDRNPVSADVMLPSWARIQGVISLGGSTVLMPDMPMNRLQETTESFLSPSKLIGQMNPALKLPVEMIADKKLAMDIPFTDKYEKAKGIDKLIAGLGAISGIEGLGRMQGGELMVNPKASYAVGNLAPTIAQLQRLSGGAAGGQASYQERQLSSVLNALGIPVREFGERQQRGETINRQFKVADLMKEIAEK